MGGQPGKPSPPGNPPIRREPQRPPVEEPPRQIPVPPVERPPAPMQVDQGAAEAWAVVSRTRAGRFRPGRVRLVRARRADPAERAAARAAARRRRAWWPIWNRGSAAASAMRAGRRSCR
jgi:hypothetical protein